MNQIPPGQTYHRLRASKPIIVIDRPGCPPLIFSVERIKKRITLVFPNDAGKVMSFPDRPGAAEDDNQEPYTEG